MYAKLRRAVARYERNCHTRPEGWPAGGLAALVHLGTLAADGLLHDAPRTLAYAIGRLAQIATRMRARHTAPDPQRAASAALRATRRRASATPVKTTSGRVLAFRLDTGVRWPAWILLPGASEPTFDVAGQLVMDPETAATYAPSPTTDLYRSTLRDAYHLAGLTLPLELDGRRLMAARAAGWIPAGRRPPRRTPERLELTELAHHTGLSLRELGQLSPTFCRDWLEQHRRAQAERTRADATALREALADLSRLCPGPEVL